MGTFTLRLDEVLDLGYDVWETADNGGRPYPIFDESYRDGLNQKILDHYMLHEIGQETVGKFRFALNRKMREIMPLYNQLYKSEKLIVDGDEFVTMSMVVNGETSGTDNTTSTSESSNTSTANSASRAIDSQFPQMELAGDQDYATSGTDTTGSTTTSASGNGGATQNGQSSGTMTNTTKGSAGSRAALLAQYRATFLNIDMMVIRELAPLFMQLWDTGDEFNNNGGMWYGRFGFGWYSGI